MVTRRGFLSACLALGVAPAIVRAESLMKIVVPSTEEIVGITGMIDYTQFSNELAFITRRAFVPCMIVQIYKTSPLMSELLANANGIGGKSDAQLTLEYGWKAT